MWGGMATASEMNENRNESKRRRWVISAREEERPMETSGLVISQFLSSNPIDSPICGNQKYFMSSW